MKMEIIMKNRSHKSDINRHKSRQGHKYRENKKCLSMMMLICIKQHLSNIWATLRLRWKKALLIKKACNTVSSTSSSGLCHIKQPNEMRLMKIGRNLIVFVFTTINKFLRFDGICFITTGKLISFLFKFTVNRDWFVV